MPTEREWLTRFGTERQEATRVIDPSELSWVVNRLIGLCDCALRDRSAYEKSRDLDSRPCS